MSLLNEAAVSDQEEKEVSNLDYLLEDEAADQRPGSRIFDFLPDVSILFSKTGDGSIESYIDHPLNNKKSRGMAQILRGLTGIAGELDYAIIDIALGSFQYTREGRNAANQE